MQSGSARQVLTQLSAPHTLRVDEGSSATGPPASSPSTLEAPEGASGFEVGDGNNAEALSLGSGSAAPASLAFGRTMSPTSVALGEAVGTTSEGGSRSMPVPHAIRAAADAVRATEEVSVDPSPEAIPVRVQRR
jgi:hypothetical protein